MKNFVKAHDREGHAFAYSRNRFPRLSENKETQRILIGPLIRKAMHDPDSCRTSSFEAERNTFNLVCTNLVAEI